MTATREEIAEKHAVRLRLFAYREARERRDEDMRRARELGIRVNEIAELTGLVRQHVSGILNGHR